MRLSFMLEQIGKQLVITGALVQIAGLLMMFYQATQLGGLNWLNIGLILLVAAVIAGAVWLYQRTVFWRRLEQRLLRAKSITRPPADPYRSVPWWLWVFIFVVAFSCSGAVGGTFGILLGALLLGYGLSAPMLRQRVLELERGRTEFYAVRDEQRQASLVRFTPVHEGIEKPEHTT